MADKTVAIAIFDGVEVLDFAGPFEVFAVASELHNYVPFKVVTVATEPQAITAVNSLKVLPEHTLATCPSPDILILPGGIGSRLQSQDEHFIDWVKRVHATGELVMSVCTGTRILARAGLLDDRDYTTHHEAFDEMRQLAPTGRLQPEQRFVDTDDIITSAGISAGIDCSLYVVSQILGYDAARKTADYMEYNWQDINAT